MILVYDIESYPNFLSFYIIDLMSDKEWKFYFHSDFNDNDNYKNYISLKELYDQYPIWVGYNNRTYDDTVFAYLMTLSRTMQWEEIIKNCNEIGNYTIQNQNNYGGKTPKEYINAYRERWKINSIDLMKILRHDQLKKSLKQTLINIKFHTIQSLPIEPGTYIDVFDVDDILKYNRNDVEGTKALALFIKPEIEQRIQSAQEYKIKELVNTSRASLAGKVLAIKYSRKTGLPIEQFIDSRTHTKAISIDSIISKKVSFKTPELQQLLKKLRLTVIQSTTEINYSIKIDNVTYNIKTGGLHSEDYPAVFTSTDKYLYIDSDGASYYPRNIVNERITAEHLGKAFVEIIDEDSTERIRIKHLKDAKSKNTAKLLKIILNAIFGGFNSEYKFWYDRKALVKTTINGQLFLLMLIEDLTINNFHVISANTDGIITKVDLERKNLYLEICKKWENLIKIELEFTEYSKYIRRDVNNYIAVETNGKVKCKGDLNKKNYSNYEGNGSFPGFNYPIVAEAVENYFLKDKPIEDTFKESTDILDFCLTQKADKKFQFILQYMDKETSTLIEKPLQKDLRFYVSTGTPLNDITFKDKNNNIVNVTLESGKLLKRDKTASKRIDTAICKGFVVTPYNIDYNQIYQPRPLSEFNIDYHFYKQDALQIINSIKAGTTDKKKIGRTLNAYKLDLFDDE